MATAKKIEDKKFSLKEYFRGIKIETKKVVWPDREELVSYTGVVVFTCAIFAIGFWAIDTGCLLVLKNLLGVTINM